MGLYDFDNNNTYFYGDGNQDTKYYDDEDPSWLGEGRNCKVGVVEKTGKCISTRKCRKGKRSKKTGKCPCVSRRRNKRTGKCIPVKKIKK